MDPVQLFLLGSVGVIFAILLWFAFVFPRLWLWTFLRVTGERPSRRELISRLWQIEPDEMGRLAERLDEETRDRILKRMWMNLTAWVIFGLVGLWFAGGIIILARTLF
ncbi:MAG: hypothetical protein K0U98_12030 [Deltaproteobacteria bacterium]|nr:hypothetical protein [Deltaproteobacteria bacterium]